MKQIIVMFGKDVPTCSVCKFITCTYCTPLSLKLVKLGSVSLLENSKLRVQPRVSLREALLKYSHVTFVSIEDPIRQNDLLNMCDWSKLSS